MAAFFIPVAPIPVRPQCPRRSRLWLPSASPVAPIPVRPQCPRRSRLWLHHSLFRTQRFCRCLSLPSPSRHPCPLSVSPSQPSLAASLPFPHAAVLPLPQSSVPVAAVLGCFLCHRRSHPWLPFPPCPRQQPYMAASGSYPAFPSSLFSYNKIVRQGFTPCRTIVFASASM